MRAVRLEFYKVRRRKVWLILLALIGVQFLWSLVAYFRMKPTPELLASGWLSCLQQFAMLDTIIMPFFSAVLASRLCDIEHKGRTFKLLETVQSPARLFAAKFLCAAVYLTAAAILQTVLMMAVGLIRGFDGPPPVQLFALQLFFFFVVNLAVYLIQQILSLQIQNQMVPMAVGLFGSFMGLFTLFFPKAVMRLVVWSYYALLTPIAMEYNTRTHVTRYSVLTPDWGAFFLLTAVLVALYILGRALFIRKEV